MIWKNERRDMQSTRIQNHSTKANLVSPKVAGAGWNIYCT